jgi:HD-like signal output (HDOD) protein
VAFAISTQEPPPLAGAGTQEPPSPSSNGFDPGERDVLRRRVADRLGTGTITLPLLPQVASQVLALTSQPNVDALQLSSLIHRDPALAGQVLRIANSPAYMPSMPIVSLQQAVARLGMETVTEIVLAASLQSGTFKVPGYEAALKRLWRHGLGSGLFAKEIARLLRSNVESAFLCGLLHAVGKPALLQVVADAQRDRNHERGTRGPLSDEVLRELLAEFHTGVGLRIATSWALPQAVVNAIAFYAAFEGAQANRREAAVACLADLFASDLDERRPSSRARTSAPAAGGGKMTRRKNAACTSTAAASSCATRLLHNDRVAEDVRAGAHAG